MSGITIEDFIIRIFSTIVGYLIVKMKKRSDMQSLRDCDYWARLSTDIESLRDSENHAIENFLLASIQPQHLVI